MTIIAIHADRAPLARIEIELDASTQDGRDPDFPLVTAFSGREVTLGVPVTEQTVLGAFLDGAERLEISAGRITTLTISCGTTETYKVADPDQNGTLFLARGGRQLPLDTLPLGTILTEEQKHFLGRPPRKA